MSYMSSLTTKIHVPTINGDCWVRREFGRLEALGTLPRLAEVGRSMLAAGGTWGLPVPFLNIGVEKLP
jgi:hypothetical protein